MTPGNTDSGEQHQAVQRIAVLAEGVFDVAIVGRVTERRVEVAVQLHAAGLVIDLVLVALSLGDLDGDVELHAGVLTSSVIACRPPTCRDRGDGPQRG